MTEKRRGDLVRSREMKNVDLSTVYSVCDDCARSLGFTRKDKAVGVWMDECGVCRQHKPCTALHHDWNSPTGIRRRKEPYDQSNRTES